MAAKHASRDPPRRAARLLFRVHVENGVSVSLYLAAVALAAGIIGGLEPGVFAAIGAMCISIVDQPGPLPGKLRAFIAALLASSMISLLAGLASGRPLAMAGVVTLTSLGLAFATAFGRPALTLAITGVLALVIGMAIPAGNPGDAFQHAGLFLAGGAAYAVLAMVGSWSLDDRTRRMSLNEALLAFAVYLRARAELYNVGAAMQSALANVIERHGVLMERFQTARDTVFSGPPTAKRRQWIAGMLALLDLYEAVLSSDADWEALRATSDQEALRQISALSRAVADDIEAMALVLVSGIGKSPACQHPEILAALDDALERLAREDREETVAGLHSTRVKLARAMRRTRQLAEVLSAIGDTAPPLPAVALAAFVQPPIQWRTTFREHLTLTSPVMRYAIRLTLAMLAGYAMTAAFPTYVHGGWILLTVALIMRANYAITRQRRNDRLFGTLAGCVLAAVLILILPPYAVVAIIIIGVGLAHAYATVNYKITSFAASLMALLLLHFLEPQTFYVGDRIIDTLIGAALSMAFARVLPSWEGNDVPRLVSVLVAADRTFAAQALTLNPGDQPYRLARKQALDRFTDLAATTRRLSSEPHHDNRQLVALNELLAANYLFASDLASVQGMLRARAGEVDTEAASTLLNDTRNRVMERLTTASATPPPETLRRRGWFELSDTEPLTILRRRLLHIEHGAQRLAAQAGHAQSFDQRIQ
jgi:uncharacterized membrane protein YccC